MTEYFYYSSLYCSSNDMNTEQVMSPNWEANDDTNAAQASSAIGHERAVAAPATVVSPTAYARSVEPDSLARILEMLTDINLRMQMMEASQARMDEDELMRGAYESELFR